MVGDRVEEVEREEGHFYMCQESKRPEHWQKQGHCSCRRRARPGGQWLFREAAPAPLFAPESATGNQCSDQTLLTQSMALAKGRHALELE